MQEGDACGPGWPGEKSSHYVWTKGCQKRSSFEKFLIFFVLLCCKPGGFNGALHLLSHWKGRLWGCSRNIFFIRSALHRPLWLQSYILRRVKNRSWDGTLRNLKVRFHAGLRDRGFMLFELKSAECIENAGFFRGDTGWHPVRKKLLVFRGSVRLLRLSARFGKRPLTILGQRGAIWGGVLGKTLQMREIFIAESCHVPL